MNNKSFVFLENLSIIYKIFFKYKYMYDIKIFIEENGQFGARVNAGKEIIYGLGNNQHELMQNIKEGLELSFENKI